MNTKKLYKSKNDRKLAGVCGGVAAYLGMDSTVVRIIWVLLALMGSLGVWAYIICAFVLPDEPEGNITVVNDDTNQ